MKILKTRKIWLALVVVLLVATVWDDAIAQDAPQISPFELARYRAGGSVQDAIWNADESAILTTTRRNTLQIWDENAEAPHIVLFTDGWVDGATWNADESAVLAWVNAPLTCVENCQYAVNVWTEIDEPSNEPSVSFAYPAFIYSATWNTDQTQILTASADGTVRIWSIEDGDVMAEFTHDADVLGAIWNSDETQILSWSMDETARLWDVENGTTNNGEIARFEHDGWLEGAIWDESEERVLTWGRDGFAKIWSTDGELEQTFSHDHWVTSAEWSADGRQILTSSMDGTLRVWDARSGDEDFRLEQRGMVQGATWNSDETRILAWAWTEAGYTVTIWDIENERIIATLSHEDVIRGARWNTDNNRVLTWSDDGTVRMWVVPSGDDCVIMSSITVRQRSIPSTDGEIMGRLFEGDASVGIGQAVGDDGFVWYQLIDESWVRSDVVEATGMCETLPEVNSEEIAES